ncbi:MAG: hypothetical protein ACREI3_04895 [Nitrospirales bacterium]
METKHPEQTHHESKYPAVEHSERTYLYRHAGIREREGAIPLWLVLVVVGLLIWSVYYTIVYWSAS